MVEFKEFTIRLKIPLPVWQEFKGRCRQVTNELSPQEVLMFTFVEAANKVLATEYAGIELVDGDEENDIPGERR